MKQKKKIIRTILTFIVVMMIGIASSKEQVLAGTVEIELVGASTPNWECGAYSTNNPFAQSSLYGQCTWYAYGRALELTGKSLPCRGNAGTWYSVAESNGWSVGSTPRANSIAVFSTYSGYGHVAYVEAVNGSTVTLSEANNGVYGNTTDQTQSSLAAGITYYSGSHDFTTSQLQNRYTGTYWEKLIGYIYLTNEGTPGTLTISAKSSYYSTEDVVVSWNTPSNTAKYGFTLRHNPSTGDLVDHYVTGNSYNLGKLAAGNYRLWMAPYNSSGTRGTVVYVDFTVVSHSHSYTNKVTKNPTCTATGVRTYTCSCGSSYTETIAKTSHTVVTDAAVAATCTQAGKTAGSHCKVCNTVIKKQETIAAKGHTAVTDAAVAATCTQAGKTAGSHCKVCNTVIKKQETIAAKGHTAVTNAAVAATCTQAGKTAGSYCKVCNTIIKKQETIPAKGHTIVTDAAVAATCTQAGKTAGSHCKVCNLVVKKQEIIPRKAHNYTSQITKATTKKNGSISSVCSTCGTKDTSTIYMPKKLELSKKNCEYTGKACKPSVVVKDSKGKVIDSSNYTITYSKNKSVGKASVKVTFKGDAYSGSLQQTFTITPKKTSISKVTAKSKGFSLQWKMQKTQVTGYEIQYSTNKSFTKATTKTVAIKKNTTKAKTITKLKAKQKYYVRVRTYKTVKVNGKNTKIYSDWSKAKTVTTKK